MQLPLVKASTCFSCRGTEKGKGAWMGMEGNHTKNCTHQYEGTDDSRFGEPLPWVGLYAAVASAVCAIIFTTDFVRSFRRSKLWVPPKLFVLNAAVLTILGVATKIPNDINGTMPGLFDQLTKPTGMLLICVAMSHAMPSLGVMDNLELLSNMVALGILVVSTAANIWVQIYTGLITRYAFVNKFCSIVMVLMYLILASHSLSVASIKQHLEKQYQSKHREILVEVGDHGVVSREKLKEYVSMYWLMALTSSPDFVLTTCGVSAACMVLYSCLPGGFFYSLFSSIGIGDEKRCYMSSEYKWSTVLIFSVQLVPFILGYASVFTRGLEFGKRGLLFVAFRKRFDVEGYKLQQLQRWKRDPLPFLVRKERVRRAAYQAKNLGVDLLILFQWIMTFLTRLILIVGFYGGYIVYFIRYTIYRLCLLVRGESPISDSEEAPQILEIAGGFVLSLEELDKRVRIGIALAWKDYPDRWFEAGQARSPNRLCELVKESSLPPPPPPSDEGISPRVQRLRTTSISRSHAITSELLEDCWSLHLATLMCVIYAAFYGTSCSGQGGAAADLGSLVRALDEGFLYFTLVDDNSGKSSKKALQAAKMVRDNLLFRREWLDMPLHDQQTASVPFCGTIRDLKARAERRVEHEKEGLPEQLSLEALAADSMSRITGALQLYGDGTWSLEEMRAEAAALVESCLKDLPIAIFRECSRGSYGLREDNVRLAAQVLGETWDILQIFETRRLSTSDSAIV